MLIEANDQMIYSDNENAIWENLYNNQIELLKNKAFDKFLNNLDYLALPKASVPQLTEVSTKIKSVTGWQLVPVEGLIDYQNFFNLLANRKFPSTTYIRKSSELNLSKDPDIFHEIFGHSPMLLDIKYATAIQNFASTALKAPKLLQPLLQRVLWFTIETGLINTKNGLRIYGSSILSSALETIYSLNSNIPLRKNFSLIDVMRTPYRADILQPIYYVIDSYESLFDLLNEHDLILHSANQAYNLGEYKAHFPIVHNKYISINCCRQVTYSYISDS